MRKSQVPSMSTQIPLRAHNSSATLIIRQHFQTTREVFTYKALPGFSITVMSKLGCPTLGFLYLWQF